MEVELRKLKSNTPKAQKEVQIEAREDVSLEEHAGKEIRKIRENGNWR